MIRKIVALFRKQGLFGLVREGMRFIFPEHAEASEGLQMLVSKSRGLEIGGPSGVFGRAGVLPLYQSATGLDNCNFSSETTWEGKIDEGQTFRFSRSQPPGRQFVGEASRLSELVEGKYDYILSSHVIEHMANPLHALNEWKSVLKPGGTLVLVVPHKQGTFDHRREVTLLTHLEQDLEAHTGEDDLTHLPEILAKHDFALDPEAGGKDAFELRSRENFHNRCLHQHVFDGALVANMIDRCEFQIDSMQCMLPFHIVVVASVPPPEDPPHNSDFLIPNAQFRLDSPFSDDRCS
ncbi:MAG: class I SAM-dependent methyltransferase [Halioglobus sp.]